MLNYTTFLNENSKEWVVFLHGIGGGSGIWVKQIRDFKKHFNLLLIDLPGHGKSDYGLVDMKDYSFYEVSKEVFKVLEQENIQEAHFVEISLGTIIIQTMNEISPGRIKSMVLGGAVEKLNLSTKVIMKFANMMKNFMPYMWIYKVGAWILMPRGHHKEARLAFVKEAYKLGRKEFLHWYNLNLEIEKTIRKAKEKLTKTPKLYIMGSEDYMFLPHVKSVVNKMKNEELKIIEKCGHVCNIEKPKEFNELSLNFLNQKKCILIAG